MIKIYNSICQLYLRYATWRLNSEIKLKIMFNLSRMGKEYIIKVKFAYWKNINIKWNLYMISLVERYKQVFMLLKEIEI